jgi:cellulose synthase/poly-beta-1,6-N-acetylglucosamine synthase-like glycosyltransferase/spore germination protein YaaH/peptidoglycan/xylan/chitin deacetylase (PgdA/CDA1 family)
MPPQQQIFQTASRLRWNTFKWLGRLVLFILLLMIPLVWIAMARNYKPPFVGLSKPDYTKNSTPITPKGFTIREKKKYHGFNDFLKARKQDFLWAKKQNALSIAAEKNKLTARQIRSAFFVDWDPQAFFSLQSHINSLNMVMPEWFFLDAEADTLKADISLDALKLMKENKITILPMLENIVEGEGTFNTKLLEKVLTDKALKEKLITSIILNVKQYGLQGINIDFEELNGKAAKALPVFQKELYTRMHNEGLLVSEDIPVDDDNYNLLQLNSSNDYFFLMAYDQHSKGSIPGPISEQSWIEKNLDEAARIIPSEKIILCIGGYGLDWPEGDIADAVTYQEAISLAKQFNVPVEFNNNTYCCSFSYSDFNGVVHQVYFNDAAGNFNSVRFADQYGTGGVALWRLGSEDERIWKFYSRDLSNSAIEKNPFDFSRIATINISTDKPDFFGEGEVLDMVQEPQKGIIGLEVDSLEKYIAEETYKQLPTRYVMRKFGKVHHQVILTFDDGPDPEYTPRILDILEKEKVPAVFFVVGVNAEAHLPILKRIYNDGFEIGNHTFTHPNIATVSGARASTEMEATRLLIESTIGRSTILFRAPFNADAEPSKEVELRPIWRSKLNSYYTVGESIDPEDWEPNINADSVYNRVVRRYEMDTSRGIILMHDAGGNREATVRALPRIIQYFKNKGIGFIDVGTLLNLTRDQVMPPVHDGLIMQVKWVDKLIYWIGNFLSAAFWLAIFLGMARILLMGVLAFLQYRKTKKQTFLPAPALFSKKVCVIVPAYNEEINAVKTIRNLLQQEYSNFGIIFVDDGSTDNTFKNVQQAFANHAKVKVYTKPNGGKASALNYGIRHTDSEYVVCIDADTQLMPDAIQKMMKYFYDERVAAVAGNVKVGNEKNILTTWQSIEYTTAQNFDRRAFDYVNGISVVPGAIGAFKTSAIKEAGGFTTDTLAEDCDLTIRILRNGHIIRNCSDAIAVTESPETLKQFMKQRFRWSYGIMQSFWKNKDACFNPRYKSLGMISLPNILLFQVIMPIIAPLADLLFFFSIAWNWNDATSLQLILGYYAVFLLIDVAVSAMAFSFEKEKLTKLLWLLPQRFVYRQLMYVILFRSLARAIKGETQGWGVLKRTGNVVLQAEKITKVS